MHHACFAMLFAMRRRAHAVRANAAPALFGRNTSVSVVPEQTARAAHAARVGSAGAFEQEAARARFTGARHLRAHTAVAVFVLGAHVGEREHAGATRRRGPLARL